MSLLVALKHRVFLFLWVGQTISRLGDRIYGIALALWVLDKTNSPAAFSAVLIASSVPSLVFLLIGGVIADRLPRLPIMLISDMSRGVLVAVITILAYTNTLPLWPIIGVSFCFGVMDAFFQPAYSAVIPQILPKPDLASANSLRVLSGRSMALVGPIVGAVLVTIGGTPIAFAVNSASFFLSAACLFAAIPLLRTYTLSISVAESRPPFRQLVSQLSRDLREGLTTVGSITWVWLTILIAGVANLIAGGITSVTLRVYVATILHSPLLYGGLTAAMASGAMLGAVWFGSQHVRHRGWFIYGLFMLNVLVLSLIGFIPLPPIILGAMFIYGWCEISLGLAWVTALQEYIPNDKMGRVTSIDLLGSSLGEPLSLGLAGIMTDRFGALPLLQWGGISAALIVGVGLFSRSVRALD